MVVGLFGLSLVMIVGGVAAVVQGFPYVRLESGLAMVIGGATASSAGVILLGLSVIVTRLSRLERVFAEGRDGGNVSTPTLSVPAPVVPPPTIGEPIRQGPADGTAALRTEPRLSLRESEPSSPAPSELRRTEPAIDEVREPEDDLAAPYVPAPIRPEANRRLTDGEPERRAERIEPVLLAEEDLFTPTKPAPRPDATEPVAAISPASGEAGVAKDPEPTPKAEEPTKSEERTVVGTYASGGNTYVMFADGSIEADTPRGRFNFGSLTELKAFVEAGGESGGDARGAA